MKQSYWNAKRRKTAPEPYKHDLGQHFLYDEVLLRRLIETTGLKPEEDVLEIGPGEGTLTELLCEASHQVVSVEVDHDLFSVLCLMGERHPNLRLVEGDIRKIPFDEITGALCKPFHVIANIPYNITTPILELLWKHRSSLCQLSMMVQKEVAEKLAARPGDALYGLPSLTAQYYSDVRIAEVVPAECFTPPPKVDSAFILMKLRKEAPAELSNEARFFMLMKAGFAQRRKTLPNALKSVMQGIPVSPVMEAMGLKANSRAEELSLLQWMELSNRLEDCLKGQEE